MQARKENEAGGKWNKLDDAGDGIDVFLRNVSCLTGLHGIISQKFHEIELFVHYHVCFRLFTALPLRFIYI
jgi:hypothetical protein